MSTLTAGDAISQAAKAIGQLAPGAAMEANEQSDALDILNNLLDSKNLESLIRYRSQEDSFTWAANAASYTIGPTGNFVTTRPLFIDPATYIRDTRNAPQNVDLPLTIANNAEWNSIVVKTLAGSYPQVLYYDPLMDNGTLYLWPQPAFAMTLVVNQGFQIAQFASTSDSLVLPPGYRRWLIYTLAQELAPSYGAAVDSNVLAQVVAIAAEASRNVKRINNQESVLGIDSRLLSNYYGQNNIYVGLP